MIPAAERATLRPPRAPRGQRAGVRRSRLTFTSGSVHARAVDGAPRDSAHQVVALTDDPVRLDGDDQAAEAGTLGMRFADGTAAYLRLADWDQPWLTPQDRDITKRTLARRLGVSLERPAGDDPPPSLWRPAATARLSGVWISRIGNIVPGVLVVAMLITLPVASWLDADPQTMRTVTRALLLTAAGTSLALVVLLWSRWLLHRGREGSVRPEQTVRPRPKGTVDRRFLRTARLLGVDGEVCVRGGFGEEQWLGGPGDDFGVQAVEVGPGFRWEEPHCKAVNLLDARGRAAATLDFDDWFGAPDALSLLQRFCAQTGIDAHDLTARSRQRGKTSLFRSHPHRAPEWLKPAGLADSEMISMAAVAVVIAVGGVQLDMPAVAAVAAVPSLLLVVPAAVRTVAHYLWLRRPATGP